jgi:hypothetical protein
MTRSVEVGKAQRLRVSDIRGSINSLRELGGSDADTHEGRELLRAASHLERLLDRVLAAREALR